MRFESPWAFILLAIVPILFLRAKSRNHSATMRYSGLVRAVAAGRSLRVRFRQLPIFLRLLSVVLCIIALARPQEGVEKIRDTRQGIAIAMVIDRSSSMGAQMNFSGEQLNRLEVVKRVFTEFVLGNDSDLDGRPNDLVGMITFARFPETVCPLTLAHGALSSFLDTVSLAPERSRIDGTAIGDAIALAAARLKTAEETFQAQQNDRENEDANAAYIIKSKIIILLTDGVHNVGDRSPLEAAELAKQWGIKIYTIGVGGGELSTSNAGLLGLMMQQMRTPQVDQQTLQAIADRTGAIFRMAESADGLRDIYSEIDALERTEVSSFRYVDYRERFQPWLLWALALLVVEIVLSATLFRSVP